MHIFRSRPLYLYGLMMGLLFFALQFLEYRFLVVEYSLEIYSLFIALVFTFTGIWVGLKIMGMKKQEKPAEPTGVLSLKKDIADISSLGLSQREIEVWKLMAQGHSNREIADKLFMSPNPVKTHSSKLFQKLDVQSRTQVALKARDLNLQL